MSKLLPIRKTAADQHHSPVDLPPPPPGERPGIHSTLEWVGLGASLDLTENLAHAGIRSPDRPVRCESLYGRRYPNHLKIVFSNTATPFSNKVSLVT